MLASGSRCLIWRVASMPFNTGMPMSIRTTSGRSFSAISTVTAPSVASPTTSMSGSDESSKFNPERTMVWSSAISTRIGLGIGHLVDGDPHPHRRSFTEPGLDLDLPAAVGGSLPHATQAQPPPFSSVAAHSILVEAEAIVMDLAFDSAILAGQPENHMSGLGKIGR